MPQLEAGIAQLKDAFAAAAADRSGDRAAGPALAHHPERAWSLAGARLPNGQAISIDPVALAASLRRLATWANRVPGWLRRCGT